MRPVCATVEKMSFFLRYFPVGVDRAMSLVEHLEDLRRRVIFSLAGLLITCALGLWAHDWLLHALLRPAPQVTHLVALTVLEPLLVRLRLAFVFGLVLAFPWILSQALLFVIPALTAREGRYVLPISLLSLVLAVAGVAFGYFFVLPPSTGWLLNQAGATMSLEISALAYVSYTVLFLAILAFAFQTPLVVVTLVGLGIMSPARLRAEWRTIYVSLVVLAAMITPDWNPVSNALVAVAMIGLYELSLLLVRVILPKR